MLTKIYYRKNIASEAVYELVTKSVIEEKNLQNKNSTNI